ncbi:cysteine hydrolase family protein [Granulosicoccus antarcticus]|uniref:Streptothricin hydrolase n=1 Tax=Granulosicoccus antarcticus IMCC3135 TaxID=1192854 RepID=A0A2Z2NXH2_9GAMM|nr:cysteine hydrolase family protein [Granulosicoccus antarcticus]ASJ76152.1 Streptothricin hydrolase [Granulosicoccus antarcticus IMCC3135]
MTHPTIRALLGAASAKSIDRNSTALLVIDFQNEYFTGKLPIPNGKTALANAKRLIDMADGLGIPVFHIQHVTPAGAPIFAEDGQTVAFHPDIQPATNHVVVRKSSISVFPTTDIDAQLKAKGIKTLIVSGLMTHACVAGASRDAVPLGYDVIVADDACATRDLTVENGQTVPHAALHQASLASLSDTFADVQSTAAILALS